MALNSSSQAIQIQTVDVPGRLDALRAVELRQEIQSILDGGIYRIIVDLSRASFVDSAGLAALAKGMKDCRSKGGDLRLVRADNPDAARVFSLTRFDQVFIMGSTADELVGSW